MAGKRGVSTMKLHCTRCGRYYFETRQSGRTLYCPDCRPIVRREQNKVNAQRRRARLAAERAANTFEAKWQAILDRAYSRPWWVNGRLVTDRL